MKTMILWAVFSGFLAASASADCPAKPPRMKWNTHSDDQRLSAEYLAKLLSGKTVKYDGGGRERYQKNGQYTYSEGGKKWSANAFRFYDGGVRCIGYSPEPRFDLYVANNGKLILVNARGGRYEVK